MLTGRNIISAGIVLVSALLLSTVAGCSKISTEVVPRARVEEGPVTYAIGIKGSNDACIAMEDNGDATKSEIASNGLSVDWKDGDEIAVWAYDADKESYSFENRRFKRIGSCAEEALFTADFAQAMAQGNYRYYACYPVPLSVSGTRATFDLPAVQNGKSANGTDIMVATPVEHGALKKHKTGDYSELYLKMKHLTHLLNFFLPAGVNGLYGESLERIVIDFPFYVAGTVTKDIAGAGEASLSNGVSRIELKLDEPLAPSTENVRKYASASIFPVSSGAEDQINISVYSKNWRGTVRSVRLNGRDFQAGHATDVNMLVTDIYPYYTLAFQLGANNLGENIQKITFTLAQAGHRLGDDGGRNYVLEPGGDITPGTTVEFQYENQADFLAMAGQTIDIQYDSEHVESHQSIVLPNLSGMTRYTSSMTVPYLLYEDFSEVSGFSSNDAYSSSFNSGEKDPVSFLNGWTGSRVGGSAGKSVRLAARRETSARYHSRIDSAPLAKIKAPVTVKLTFRYGMAEKHGGIASKQYGMDFFIGYVRQTQGYSCPTSGEKHGTFEGAATSINETNGSWTNLPHTYSGTLNLPAVDSDNPVNRISWFASVENHAGANNNTDWLYIDDVVVQVNN